MTQTQKKIFEIPLLILIFWLLQSCELFLFQLPWNLGGVHLTPIFIVYVTLTRSWPSLTVLNLVLAIMGSFNIGYSAGIFIASQMWTAFVVKIVVQEFALEGRRSFTFLTFGAGLFAKSLTWVLLNRIHAALPVHISLINAVMASITTSIGAWIFYPMLLWWDEFFDHPTHENRELSGTLR